MSTTADDRSRHLLTRTDLARLEVPEDRVGEWLAAGSLEQVGALPAADGADPVFAVHAVDLRAELHDMLVALGKANAALGPVQARSQLLRVLLAERGIDDGDAAETPVETGATPPVEHHAEHRDEPRDDAVARTMDNVSRAMAELLEAAAEPPAPAADEAAPVAAQAPPFGDMDTAVVLIEDGDDQAADESASEDQMDEVVPEPKPADADPELEVLFEEPAGGEFPGDRADRDDFATDTGPAFDDSGDADGSPAEADQPADDDPPAAAPDPAATEPDFFAEHRDDDAGLPPSSAPPPLATEVEAFAPAIASPTAIANNAVVDSLQQIHLALLTIAARPQPAPDLQGVALALDRGLRELRDAVVAADVAARLDARFEQLTGAVTSANAALVEVLAAPGQSPAVAHVATAPAAPHRAALAMVAWLLLSLGWAGALWLHTGEPRTALLALVGAIAVGCPALLLRR